jgi:hypothetical protein
LDLAVEVPRIEPNTPDRLVDLLKLRKREGLSAEGGGERGVLEFGTRTFHAVYDDALMVERESHPRGKHLLNRSPARTGRVCAGHRFGQPGRDRQVSHGHHPAAGVPTGISVHAYLF